MRRSRVHAALIVAIGVLVVANVTAHYGPKNATLVFGPVMAAALIALARWAGLSFEELGLGRRHLKRGAAYAAVLIGAVAVVYVLGAAIPATRPAFLDERYQLPMSQALVTALIVIPVATVIPEEIAFRGVLWGLLRRGWRPVVATVGSSVLFGLWHVLPSLRLNSVNPAIEAIAGPGPAGVAVAVVCAVIFTGLSGVIFCELRRRSGSLLAPMGLHWAVNGLGVLMTAALAGRH